MNQRIGKDGKERKFWSSRNMRVDLLERVMKVAVRGGISAEEVVNRALEVGLRGMERKGGK